ncbi:MAG: hypothetical protein Ta2E_02940 [Mycoplasmoidaceae bacterium]|nr:MAG: hypothetical protein Ta2E_02940 [Mycoplasmoidaceae bacterium]
MKNNLKENTKLRCKDSPCKEDVGKIFEYENIIDKKKQRKKMRPNAKQQTSNNAPGWFKVYVRQLNERLDMGDRKEDERWAKQYEFNQHILGRLNGIEKDVHDIKDDIDNIVKKNKLKR